MLGKTSLNNKSYKKKITKKSGVAYDYMKDIPLTFEMDDIPYKEQVASVKKNSFAINKQQSQEFKKQTSNFSASTNASSDKSNDAMNKCQELISVMNLESPEGHFTDEKIQALYQGTHVKQNH